MEVRSDRMRCRVQYLDDGRVRISCGPDPQTICQVADCDGDRVALCDYPVAHGKTWDKGMCEAHRTRVGENTDYCPAHQVQIGVNGN
jgi:hypothetical protein